MLVKIFWRGEVIKTHPRGAPGSRSTDAADYPAERSVYAMRDIDHLRRVAASHGASIGVYADTLLSHPLPWTTMRQVYR
ncbi:MAG: IS21 family transposase, partial [Actinomycetota bacterium]